jgi:quinol monooxygenase YgiN
MSTTFIATLVIKAGHEAEFERLQKELSELTHAHEPGTLVYDVIKSRTKPRTYVVYGRFTDEQRSSPHRPALFTTGWSRPSWPASKATWICKCTIGES